MPGYPYATVVPNVLDEQHRPILLISALAERHEESAGRPQGQHFSQRVGYHQRQDGQPDPGG